MKFDCEEGTILYPKFDKIFEAFRYFDLDQTKVVILGMDPYINEGQAMGLRVW
jgi:uracil-DNA glycosylase